MSLLGKRKTEAKDSAVAESSPEAPKPEKKASSGGIVQWLKDSYNGLYKIVLEPSMPTKASVALLLAGLAIGLFWGYSVTPTVFTGANPNRMNQPAQDQWVKMVAGSYTRGFYPADQAQELLTRIDSPEAVITRLLNDPNTTPSDREALSNALPLSQGVAGTPTPQSPGFLNELISGWGVPLLLVMVVFPILTLLWRLLFYPNVVAPMVMKVQESRDPVLREKNMKARADLKRLQEQNAELAKMKKETVADVELGTPVTQVLKVFTKGRSFDESDEIEAGEEFLGQCGAVIPEAVEPDAVAIEIWLFDMFATDKQNHKRLFVTPMAFNDPSTRSRLSSDPDVSLNEAIVAEAGSKIVIDSQKVRLQAEMVSVELGADGRFESFRMKMTAWKRDGAKTPVPMPQPPIAQPTFAPPPVQPAYTPPVPQPTFAPPPVQPTFAPPSYTPLGTPQPTFAPPPASGLPPMAAYDDIQFDPPPVMPQRTSPPQGYSPLPPPEDDDPFGATGDFTPLPRN